MAAEWYRQSEGGSEEREAARTAAARVDVASRLRWEAAMGGEAEMGRVRGEEGEGGEEGGQKPSV